MKRALAVAVFGALIFFAGYVAVSNAAGKKKSTGRGAHSRGIDFQYLSKHGVIIEKTDDGQFIVLVDLSRNPEWSGEQSGDTSAPQFSMQYWFLLGNKFTGRTCPREGDTSGKKCENGNRNIAMQEINKKGMNIERIDENHYLVLVTTYAYDRYDLSACPQADDPQRRCSYWFIVGPKSIEEINVLTEMSERTGMKASNNQRYLATWSYCEGVSCVEVHPMKKIIDRDDEMIFSVCDYIGGISFHHWEGNSLFIKSGIVLDKHSRQPGYLFRQFWEAQIYRVDFPQGTVTPFSPGAKDPVGYWISIVKDLSKSNDARDVSVESLRESHDPRAIPFLEDALKTEQDPEVKKTIEYALEELRK